MLKKLKSMSKQKKVMAVILILAIITYISYNIFLREEIYALSKYGSRGDEVIQIQTKLKRWGYYSGSIDRNIW